MFDCKSSCPSLAKVPYKPEPLTNHCLINVKQQIEKKLAALSFIYASIVGGFARAAATLEKPSEILQQGCWRQQVVHQHRCD
eukprot:2208535-Amphidinium_carterae.1